MEEKELPDGWEITTIKEINTRKSKNIKPQDFPSRMFESYSVPIFDTKKPEIVLGESIKSSKQIVYGNEVLLCKINPRINRVWIVGNFSNHAKIASSEWIIVQPNEKAESNYLRYLFSGPSFRTLMQRDVSGVGGSLTRARPKIVEHYPIPLPPLPIQNQIIAKLDVLFGHLDVLMERLEEIPKMIEEFRQSVLTQAVTGKLTEEWRVGKDIGKWEEKTLIDLIIEKPRNGFSPRAVSYETEVKSLSLSATTSGKFDSSKVKYLDIDKPELESHLWLKKGDILIQRSNSLDYVGTAALYDSEDFEFIYPDIMMKIRANNEVDKYFLLYTLWSKETRDYYKENATGTAGNMPKINQGIVSQTPVPLPDKTEQAEIVKRVESLFTKAVVIEARYAELKGMINDLPQAILAKAFRGELIKK